MGGGSVRGPGRPVALDRHTPAPEQPAAPPHTRTPKMTGRTGSITIDSDPAQTGNGLANAVRHEDPTVAR